MSAYPSCESPRFPLVQPRERALLPYFASNSHKGTVSVHIFRIVAALSRQITRVLRKPAAASTVFLRIFTNFLFDFCNDHAHGHIQRIADAIQSFQCRLRSPRSRALRCVLPMSDKPLSTSCVIPFSARSRASTLPTSRGSNWFWLIATPQFECSISFLRL